MRAFFITAFAAAIGGFFLAAQVGIGDPRIGSSYTLTSIAAAVLGGASLFGGRGSFVGAVVGALFLNVVINVLPFLGWSASLRADHGRRLHARGAHASTRRPSCWPGSKLAVSNLRLTRRAAQRPAARPLDRSGHRRSRHRERGDQIGRAPGQGSVAPATSVGIICTVFDVVRNSVRRSAPPHTTLPQISGVSMRPMRRPSGVITHTPPGPDVHTLPRASHSMPSTLPSAITPRPISSSNSRQFAQRAVGGDVEHLDLATRRVVDVEQRLVG